MTRKEFIEKAKLEYEVKEYTAKEEWIIKSHKEDISEFKKYIEERSVTTDTGKIERVKSFLDESLNVISLAKVRADKKDWVHKDVGHHFRGFYCERLGRYFIEVAYMNNTSSKIIKFYLSDDGCFYDSDYKLIANDPNEFFEFFLNVTCEDHEQPSGYTYQLLRDAGWYEGRKEDMTELIERFKEEGYELTDIQKAIISEFSGLVIENPRIKQTYHNRVRFNGDLSHHVFNNDRFIPDGVDVIEIGLYKDNVELYLSKDGRIFNHMGFPVGLDFIEGLHILLNK